MSGQLESSVVKLKVVEALRAETPNDIAHLADIYNLSKVPNLLNLAVQSSNPQVLEKVLELYNKQNRSINEPNESGNTPLHMAVLRKRTDAIKLLMDQPYINDTLPNRDGLTAGDMSEDPAIKQLIARLQSTFAEKIAVQLRYAFQSQDTETLDAIFANPRVPEFIDINGLDPDTGLTVLHASAASNNQKLVELILANGGNPLAKDAKGRIPSDVTTSESIKRLLNNAAKSQAILIDSIQGKGQVGPPKMSGYLSKWTNFTTGYKVRWFNLNDNRLSYSKSPQESVRGTISLRNARVKVHSGENRRFEIKTPNSKFHLRANNAVEANQWVWSLQNAITYARDGEKPKSAGKAGISRHASKLSISSAASVGSLSALSSASGSAGVARALDAANNRERSLGHTKTKSGSGFSRLRNKHRAAVTTDDNASATGDPNSFIVNDLGADIPDDKYDSTSEDEGDWHTMKSPAVSLDGMHVQLAAIRDLIALLAPKADEPGVREALTSSMGNIDSLSADIASYSDHLFAEINRLRGLLDRSDNGQRLWAKQVRDLEVKVGQLEEKLYVAQNGTANHTEDEEDDDDVFFDTVDEWQSGARADPQSVPQTPDVAESVVPETESEGGHGPEARAVAGAAAGAGAGAAVAGSSGTTGEGDSQSEHTTENAPDHEPKESDQEESAAKSKVPANCETLLKLPSTSAQKASADKISSENSFAGYDDPPRKKLTLDADNRPRISLWGILKNLVGKDMTRMTLPISFNECTNLLQRSAEDMEYVDLLDKAAGAINDPGLRMAYVAAFATSSYSSTINRVAKPFNPLLGETYELCRPDHGFRMVSEQVSHHPPIGALIAESPRWDFYGESNVDSNFNGRSFDIKPLGLWYLNLRPDEGADVQEELYTFRKVTSSVVGIIMGSPTVDNYGTMNIVNHTTGIECELNFKARGWRGGSAYKITGVVKDKQGKELYTIGGTWSDKLYAEKAGSQGKLLLWQVHDRQPAPFNLTPFAITLNALPAALKPWLAPTDTRLRPDQRDMEEGRYDQAGDEKHRLEQKQRAARREREESGEIYKPRWFEVRQHPVTKKDYYAPVNDYWKLRGEQQLADKGDIF